MHITLIKVNMSSQKSKDAMQPLFAAAIAAQTPADIKICLCDDRIEEIDYNKPTDLVALSVETYSAKRAYQIARRFREKGVKVMAGGFHPSLMPDECLEHTDSVFIGDIERTWPSLIEDLKKGELKKIYKADPNIQGDDIKFDRSIFEGKNYGPIEMVQWSRGCPYSCDFCSIKAFYNKKHISRPIDNVVDEIKQLKKKVVFFVDDNLYFDKAIFKLFLKALIPLKIKWACQISINISQDDELLELMQKSGCFMVLVGIESFNKDNLKKMNKQWSASKLPVDEAIKKLNAYGILIYGTFIFGYDYDTPKSFKKAIDFAIKHKFFIANFNPLYPMPGTPLYERLKKDQQLVFEKWWLDKEFYYGKSMFYPQSMTPEELESGCFDAKKKFNSWSSILKRSINPLFSHKSLQKTALFFYANMVNRKEISKKQGKLLGD